jgi:hypothetical protein
MIMVQSGSDGGLLFDFESMTAGVCQYTIEAFFRRPFGKAADGYDLSKVLQPLIASN